MHIGINIYTENEMPVCRLHAVLFKQKRPEYDNVEMPTPRFYCDGLEKDMKPSDPLYGIGLVYANDDDPITDWFDTPEEAVAEWKRLRKCS